MFNFLFVTKQRKFPNATQYTGVEICTWQCNKSCVRDVLQISNLQSLQVLISFTCFVNIRKYDSAKSN